MMSLKKWIILLIPFIWSSCSIFKIDYTTSLIYKAKRVGDYYGVYDANTYNKIYNIKRVGDYYDVSLIIPLKESSKKEKFKKEEKKPIRPIMIEI